MNYRFELPRIMLAPNGARRSKLDHLALPLSIDEIVQCAQECFAVGATGIHAHIRDAAGQHVLDVGLYRELMQALAQTVPALRVQVTSEAAGRYQAAEQQAIIRELRPAYVSVGLREMLSPDSDQQTQRQAQAFYTWAAAEEVCVQHILYSAADLQNWLMYVEQGLITSPLGKPHLLFVLGRYTQAQQSSPSDLQPFLALMDERGLRTELDWAVCAFGMAETACLLEAARQGGKMRVGFENSLWHADGSLARDNRERVVQLLQALAVSEAGAS